MRKRLAAHHGRYRTPAPKATVTFCHEARHLRNARASRFLTGLSQGKFLGQRCPKCRKVYVPPRGSCPTDGVPTEEEVELGNAGTLTTYCVVNVPFAGQSIEIPYTCAQILLDGANLSFMGLIQEVPTDEVRMGMRVEAVWKDPSEWGPTMESVRYFRPNGEPDAEYGSYREYL